MLLRTSARLCALGIALAATLGAALPPAVLAAAPTPPGGPVASPAAPLVPPQEKRARAVAEQALFAARIAPDIAAVMRANPASLRGQWAEDRVAAVLWLLRQTPNLCQYWTQALQTPASAEEQQERIRSFFRLPATARELAAIFSRQDGRPVAQPALTAAVRLMELLYQENLPIPSVRRYAVPLGALLEKPQELRHAVTLIKDQRIQEANRAALLAKLATDPEAAGKDLKRLEAIIQVHNRYAKATMSETGERVLLPLTAVDPEALRAVRKGGVVPLALYPVDAPQPTLSTSPRAVANAAATPDGKGAALPFALKPGERLYTISFEEGAPFFAETPLDLLAPVGPKVREVTASPGLFVADPFWPGPAAFGAPRPAFIAALCGPEELAAHLTSLSLMHAERERSLYAPGETPADAAPSDVPGPRPRFVRQGDVGLLTVLAPRADKEGLARLMGPIRAIWTRGDLAPTWAETRYMPQGTPPAGKLGASPLVQLNAADLKALITDWEKSVIEYWGYYDFIYGGIRSPEEATRIVGQQFDALRAKGFTSPLAMGNILYLLRWYTRDPAMQERLHAILDDRSLSLEQRLAAIRAASARGTKEGIRP